jgi:hypothetical protein
MPPVHFVTSLSESISTGTLAGAFSRISMSKSTPVVTMFACGCAFSSAQEALNSRACAMEICCYFFEQPIAVEGWYGIAN